MTPYDLYWNEQEQCDEARRFVHTILWLDDAAFADTAILPPCAVFHLTPKRISIMTKMKRN